MTYGSVWGMLKRLPATSQVTSQQVNDFLLAQASFALDAMLADCFPAPFSVNNITVNGMLVYDVAELRARDGERDIKTGEALRARVNSMVAGLRSGTHTMVSASSITPSTGSSETVFFGPYTLAKASPSLVPPWMQVTATRAGYQPVFDVDDWINQQVDPQLVQVQRSARGIDTPTNSGM